MVKLMKMKSYCKRFTSLFREKSAQDGGLLPSGEKSVVNSQEAALVSFSKKRARSVISIDSDVRVGIITSAAGVQTAMASTSLFLGFLDGFLKNKIDARLLAHSQRGAPQVEDGLLNSDVFLPAFLFGKYGKDYLRLVLGSENFDYVISHGGYPDLFEEQAELVYRTGAKHLLFSGESPIRWYPDLAKRDIFLNGVRENFDGVIVPSSYLKDFWVEAGFAEHEVYLTRQPVRSDFFPVGIGKPCNSVALYAGNLSHKEIDDLMDITILVKDKIPDFRLSIFADAAKQRVDEVSQMINNKQLSNSIILEGSLSLQELAKKEGEANVLLLPRRKGEFSKAGFPNKVGEYLMSGTPLVCTDVGEIKDAIGEGSAVFVASGNIEAFAKAIVEVLSDRSRFMMMGEYGREWAMNNLDSAVVSKMLLDWMSTLQSGDGSD